MIPFSKAEVESMIVILRSRPILDKPTLDVYKLLTLRLKEWEDSRANF